MKSPLQACFQRSLKHFCSHILSPHTWPIVPFKSATGLFIYLQTLAQKSPPRFCCFRGRLSVAPVITGPQPCCESTQACWHKLCEGGPSAPSASAGESILSRVTEDVPSDPVVKVLWSEAFWEHRWRCLPLQICTMPMMMMRARASSLPAVNMSCTRVAHLTLEQFTHVSSTRETQRNQRVRAFFSPKNPVSTLYLSFPVLRQWNIQTKTISTDVTCISLYKFPLKLSWNIEIVGGFAISTWFETESEHCLAARHEFVLTVLKGWEIRSEFSR